MNLAPIAVFAYNRPRHLQRTITSLLAARHASESRLRVYSDAPKRAEHEAGVREVRRYLAQLSGFATIEIVERERNWGLARSIIDGVTELSQTYGSVIVVEDDLSVAPGFLAFLNAALERYRIEPKVMQVSGYMFPIQHPEQLPPVFLTRLPTSWGWATWDRAWRMLDTDASRLLAALEAKQALRDLDLDGSYNYSEMLRMQAGGALDSWAIRWYASMFLAGGLCVRPSLSLVSNDGFDGSGVHCGTTDAFDVTLGSAMSLDFPDRIEENELAVQAIASFFRSVRPSRLRALLSGVRQRMRRAAGLV